MKKELETHSSIAISKNFDLYQEVNYKIISMLEQGVAPWRRTWSTYGLAKNYATGHVYTGINFIMMNNTLHPIPFFMTLNQVRTMGGKLKKGAKADKVIYFNVVYKDQNNRVVNKDEATHLYNIGIEVKTLKFIKYYNVFNISDVEGIELEISEIQLKPNEKIDKCESIVANMPKCPEIKHIDSKGAFYSPGLDIVNMPQIEQFESTEAYYATLFHELIHSTGHVSRLGREEVMNPHTFGSKAYSREELVAEMGASFISSSVQIDFDKIFENNVAYLAGWLKVLKEDSKFIFKVASEAQKGVDFILNL
jgi:antirestriction protein ArdC